MLFVFAGLPGTGKSTLAARLAADHPALHLRIDTIEQALRDLCHVEVAGEGYRLAYRIAADNLRLGLSVVADSCNPIELTRREWEEVAAVSGADFVNIEVVCSDPAEHRSRVEHRPATVPNLVLPTWQEVMSREYHSWAVPPLVIDTAGASIDTSYRVLKERLASGAQTHDQIDKRTDDNPTQA